MFHVHADTRRTTTTPNATMTTLASPTLGGARSSLWLVEMGPGVEAPPHAFDSEVLWAVTSGTARVECSGTVTDLAAGDTVVLPAGELRRFIAGPEGFTATATTTGGVVTREDGTVVGVPEWVA